VIVEVETPRAVGEAVRSLLRAPLVPSAVELCWAGEITCGRLAVLFEGVPAGASAQAEQAAALLADHGRARVVPEASFDREWSSVALCLDHGNGGGSAQRGAGISLELSDVVGRVPELIEAVRAVARERSLPVRIGGHAGLGVLGATYAGDDAAGQIAAVTELRRRLSPETSVVIRQAPPGVKRAIDVWGDPGDALALMRRVKGRFDPQGTLSPGRFVGGL
jgi:glycolate oxidase FAD binding subunit